MQYLKKSRKDQNAFFKGWPWKQTLLITLFFFIFTNTYSQENWTLQDCLSFVKKNNLKIQQYNYLREKLQLQFNASKKRFLPVIDARWRSASNWGFLIDPSTNILDRKFNFGNQFALTASWDVFNGEFSSPLLKLRSHELAAAEYEFETVCNTTALEVIYLYMQVVLGKEQAKNAKQRVGQLQNQHKQIKKQVENGILNKRDLLNIQSQLSSEELQLIYAENNMERAVFNLMQVIGLTDSKLISIAEVNVSDSLMVEGLDMESVFSTSQEDFSQVKGARANVEAAQAKLIIVRNSKLPVLSINAQMATRTSTFQNEEFNTQLRDNFNQQVGLSLIIPIFNRNLYQSNFDIAKLELELAKTSYQQIREDLKQKIFSAFLDYKAAYRKYTASQLGSQAIQEENRFAEKQLQLGAISAIEYGEVRSRFFASNSELLQNKYDCFFKLKILEFYQGRGLELK